MRRIWLAIFIGLLWAATAFGQRDAPVWESYLPSVSIYHQNSGSGPGAITIDFLFKKNGGPYEHVEHQAYILVYLKQDEAQILKLAADPQLVTKHKEKGKPFLEMLVEKKLVVPVESKVARLNSQNGTTPRFADVRGNPKRVGPDSLADFSFPFQFTLAYETLFQSFKKLGNFHSENVTTAGSSTWFGDKFKLLVFIPVNDSGQATKVSEKLRTTNDFANGMDFETSLLYFRPLPYEFGFKTYQGNTLLLYIN